MPSRKRERELNDRLWERVQPLLPRPAPRPRGGRPRADDRACFEGIVFVLRNGLRWNDMPERYPSGPTCWRRHAEWTGDGVWEGVWRAVLDELAEAGLLDPTELALDCTFAPAQGGDTVGVTRIGKGMKIGLAVERNGIPVGVLTDSADVGETEVGGRVLATLPPEVDPPADVPVLADRGFDSDGLRDDLAVLGFRLLAPHRKDRKRPSRNDGRRMRRYRRRYVVERTFGWLHSYRRLLVRHEWYAHLYDGFLHLACALIAIGKF